jgi:hypothetical protein
MVSERPGGAFMIARVGRFGLAGVTVRRRDLMPRRSVTRSILGARNHDIDPQHGLGFGEGRHAPAVTELAYFACMLATPCRADPSVPAEILYAVPDWTLTEWLLQMPLHRLLALLQDRIASGASGAKGDVAAKAEPGEIEDLVFPKFRLPKPDQDAHEDSPGD